MEFTLLQLTQQLDEIFDAIQPAISGSLSMKLISPSSLQSILTNVTFHLPEGYELIVGTRTEDIYINITNCLKCLLLPISTVLNLLYIFPLRL